jgi:hypothetical protein
MNGVSVNADHRSAIISGGARAADVSAVTDPLHVAAVTGTCDLFQRSQRHLARVLLHRRRASRRRQNDGRPVHCPARRTGAHRHAQ